MSFGVDRGSSKWFRLVPGGSDVRWFEMVRDGSEWFVRVQDGSK